MEDADPLSPWLCARAYVHEPPEWLSLNTRASFGFAAAHRSELNGFEILRRGVLREVTLLSPSRAPAEALARVVLLRSAPSLPNPRDDEEMIALRRDLDGLGPDDDPEPIIAAHKARSRRTRRALA